MRTLARDRRTLRKGLLRVGLPRVFAGIGSRILQGFCRGFLTVVGSPRVSLKIFYTIFAVVFAAYFLEKNLPECLQKPSGRVPGASPEPPRTVPERLQTGSQSNFKKITPKVLTTFVKFALLGSFLDPAGAPKSTKNGPGAEKVCPETAPEPIFCVFSRRCRSEAVLEPIFGGSDP